ncbi:mechanosensitive ion channel family protein [Candidatus Hydrogenedentota bacterium]
MEEIIEKLQTEYLPDFGLTILRAAAILLIGLWLAKILRSLTDKVLTHRRVEPTIASFTKHLVHAATVVLVIIMTLAELGVETTSFIAVLGAAGLAIGLATQGALSNLAAGILMILFRPFKIGDFIEGADDQGIVTEVQMLTTTLTTLDNKTVIIPNAKLMGDNITNYTEKGCRRVDLVFGVGYRDDIDKVKTVLANVLARDERILQEPEPMIGVLELGDNSVNFAVRPWVKPEDYWDVYFDVTENVKKAFDSEGISIPYPQRDVHLYDEGRT